MEIAAKKKSNVQMRPQRIPIPLDSRMEASYHQRSLQGFFERLEAAMASPGFEARRSDIIKKNYLKQLNLTLFAIFGLVIGITCDQILSEYGLHFASYIFVASFLLKVDIFWWVPDSDLFCWRQVSKFFDDADLRILIENNCEILTGLFCGLLVGLNCRLSAPTKHINYKRT